MAFLCLFLSSSLLDSLLESVSLLYRKRRDWLPFAVSWLSRYMSLTMNWLCSSCSLKCLSKQRACTQGYPLMAIWWQLQVNDDELRVSVKLGGMKGWMEIDWGRAGRKRWIEGSGETHNCWEMYGSIIDEEGDEAGIEWGVNKKQLFGSEVIL